MAGFHLNCGNVIGIVGQLRISQQRGITKRSQNSYALNADDADWAEKSGPITVKKRWIHYDETERVVKKGWKANKKLTEDFVFSDPMVGGVLKLHNAAAWGTGRTGGGVAVYNLTGRCRSVVLTPAGVPELGKFIFFEDQIYAGLPRFSY